MVLRGYFELRILHKVMVVCCSCVLLNQKYPCIINVALQGLRTCRFGLVIAAHA